MCSLQGACELIIALAPAFEWLLVPQADRCLRLTGTPPPLPRYLDKYVRGETIKTPPF